MSDFDNFIPADCPPEKIFEWMMWSMPDKPEYLSCECTHCSQKIEFPFEMVTMAYECPSCRRQLELFDSEYAEIVSAELHRRIAVKMAALEQESRKRNQCPNCGWLGYDIYEPSRPVVYGPMSFEGQLLAGISNCMGDAIFRPERICHRCGHRRPHF